MPNRIPHKVSHTRRACERCGATLPAGRRRWCSRDCREKELSWQRPAFEALHRYILACERAELVREQERFLTSRLELLAAKAIEIDRGIEALKWLAGAAVPAGEVSEETQHLRLWIDGGWQRLPAARRRQFVVAVEAVERTALDWLKTNALPPVKRGAGQPAKARTIAGRTLTIAEAFAPVRRAFDVSPIKLADYILDVLPTLPASARAAILPDTRSTVAPRYRLAKRLKPPAER